MPPSYSKPKFRFYFSIFIFFTQELSKENTTFLHSGYRHQLFLSFAFPSKQALLSSLYRKELQAGGRATMEKSVGANLHLPAAYNQAEIEPEMSNRLHPDLQVLYFSMIETSFVGFTVKGE